MAPRQQLQWSKRFGIALEQDPYGRLPPQPDPKNEKAIDRKRCQHRNVIERFFGAVKRFRRVASRYEKKAKNFVGFVWVAAILMTFK